TENAAVGFTSLSKSQREHLSLRRRPARGREESAGLRLLLERLFGRRDFTEWKGSRGEIHRRGSAPYCNASECRRDAAICSQFERRQRLGNRHWLRSGNRTNWRSARGECSPRLKSRRSRAERR